VVDITERKEQALALERAVAQKEMLLHEIQHRVKNSLTIVNSLLHLQASGAADVAVREALAQAAARVGTVARLYDNLHRLSDHTEVDLGGCLYDVARGVEDQFGQQNRVALVCEVQGLRVSGDTAFPVALIVNELATNAYKYAFPDNRSGTVRLVLKRDGDEVRVEFAMTGWACLWACRRSRAWARGARRRSRRN
jgi:two-component sensor histidine kinase